MAHRFLRTILAVLSVAMLYVSLAPEAPAQDTCSLATIAGKWGATLTGTVLFPAPIWSSQRERVLIQDADNASQSLRPDGPWSSLRPARFPVRIRTRVP